jgi:ADP-ribose pyrophosphatase
VPEQAASGLFEEDGLFDEPVELPVLSSEIAFKGVIWDVRREVFDYNGEEITREFVDHTGAVAVLALDDRGRVLLIKQYRHPIRRREWEIPAGLLDIDEEDPLEAAKRELAEEVDLVADEWRVLSDYVTTPGGNNEAIRIYLARGLHEAPEVFAREAEEADIERRWVTLDEAMDAVVARQVQNPSLVVGIYAAAAAEARGWQSLAAADAPWPQRAVLRSARPLQEK